MSRAGFSIVAWSGTTASRWFMSPCFRATTSEMTCLVIDVLLSSRTCSHSKTSFFKKNPLHFIHQRQLLILPIIHASMCSAVDFPLCTSHNLFAHKSGRLHTAGGALMTKSYVCWLFSKHRLVCNAVSPRVLPLLYVLSAVRESTSDIYYLRERPFLTVLRELNSSVDQ